jgi:hypothetical protein
VLSVNAGTLRFALPSGFATVGTGVQAIVGGSATLELAGASSALSSGFSRANILNGSSAPVGLLVSGTNQQIGGINGSGTTQVNAGSDLTADHIIQSALVIGGAAMDSGIVTIASSDQSGNPLGEALSIGSASPSSFDVPSLGGEGFNGDLFSANGTPNGGANPPVPEPATILLVALACLGLLPRVVRRRLW